MNDCKNINGKDTVFEEIEKNKSKLINISKKIHKNPELGYHEHKASQWLCEAAIPMGFEVEKPFRGLATAFRATKSGRNGGPTIAFLCEYDALPDLGHACGHNLIGAASLGAAMGLSDLMKDLPGNIQIIGAPAEEGGGGKIKLIEAGAFDGVDVAMMFHPSRENVLWSNSLARHKFEISFTGKSSHASGCPEKGINALDAAILAFNAVNALRQHLPSDARIHGIISEGGKAPNIIPNCSKAVFYVRALNNETCNDLLYKVKNCAKGAALATGSKVKFTMLGSYKPLRPNLTLSNIFKENGLSLGVAFKEKDPLKDLGSSDIGDVSQAIPVIHPYLSIGSPDLVGHSKEFVEASSSETGMNTMITAVKVLAGTAYDMLTNPTLLDKIQTEFEQAN